MKRPEEISELVNSLKALISRLESGERVEVVVMASMPSGQHRMVLAESGLSAIGLASFLQASLLNEYLANRSESNKGLPDTNTQD